MELAAVGHEAAVAGAAARPCRVALPCQLVEVPDHPGLPLPEERLDSRLRARPAPARRERDRNHEPVPRVDRDAQAARAGRAT